MLYLRPFSSLVGKRKNSEKWGRKWGSCERDVRGLGREKSHLGRVGKIYYKRQDGERLRWREG